MGETSGAESALRVGRNGATMLLVGAFLSGIVSQVVVAGVHPPPPWQGARDFAAHFHPIETLPYFYGLVLVAGGVMVVAACHRLAVDAEKTRTLIAVMLAAAFAAVTGLNHLVQVTFVPEMARHFTPEYDAALTAFSMGNPQSLAWTLEIWGYTLFGVATWLLAPLFRQPGVERVTAMLLVLNGIMGLLGGLLTATDMGWAMTVPGMVSYVAWDGLIAVMSAGLIWSLHRRLTALRRPTSLPAA